MYPPLISQKTFFKSITYLVIYPSILLVSISCSTDYSDLQNNPYNAGKIMAQSEKLYGYEPTAKSVAAISSIEAKVSEEPTEKPPSVFQRIKSQTKKLFGSSESKKEKSKLNQINIAGLNGILFDASKRGDIDAIWNALERGADIKASNTNGETALHSAAAHSQVEAVRVLLDSGANINTKTILGWTPLHSAARFGSSDAVMALLQAGSNASTQNTSGKTALVLARQAKHDDVVKILQSR